MAKLVENTYGDALFELAMEQKDLDGYDAEVRALRQVLAENPAFLQMCEHPNIGKEEKLDTIEKVFKGKMKDELIGLLRMMVEKGHSAEIDKVLKYFVNRVMEEKNIGIAKVITPMPLSDEKKKEVEKKLLETTKYVSFETEYRVDPELLGGMVIRIGDRVVDSSVRTKLDTLTKQLR